jgi:hypothetical protein
VARQLLREVVRGIGEFKKTEEHEYPQKIRKKF